MPKNPPNLAKMNLFTPESVCNNRRTEEAWKPTSQKADKPEKREEHIQVGDIQDSNAIAIGTWASVTYHQGLSIDEVTTLVIKLKNQDQPIVVNVVFDVGGGLFGFDEEFGLTANAKGVIGGCCFTSHFNGRFVNNLSYDNLSLPKSLYHVILQQYLHLRDSNLIETG